MTFLTFQKAWATETLPSPAPGVARPTARFWTVWWHPKMISKHFEALCWVFFFSPTLHLLHCFFFFLSLFWK